MKRKLFSHLVIVGLAALVAGTGCKHHSVNNIPIPGERGMVGNPPPVKPETTDGAKIPLANSPISTEPAPGNTTPPNTSGIGLANDPDWSIYNVDRAALKDNTIYFEYDSSLVKKSEMKNLDAVAAYLKGSAADKVGIEGNCDERGTPEYNRALGERRALAAREYLVNKGKISPDRILTKSFGDQRPAVRGTDDASRSKNRRDEFVVLKPKS